MYSKVSGLLILFLVLMSIVMSLAWYPKLPERMATHWDGNDNVDGYMNRTAALSIVPAVLLLLWGVFTVVPRIAPGEPAKGRSAARVGAFVVVLFAFFVLVHFQMIQWNLGNEIPFGVTVPVGIGVVFIFIGLMLGSVEPNWVVGIRTYWTLKNRVVWAYTHQRASLLFRILGVIYIVSAFFRQYVLVFMLLPAVFIALYLPAYSFLLYQKIEKIGKGT